MTTTNANQKDTNVQNQIPLIRTDRTYESLRYSEYAPTHGLGELGDNAVEAGATHMWIMLSKNEKRQKAKKRSVNKRSIDEIAVVDDGSGMELDVLCKCLALGESIRPPRGKSGLGIGRFGVGMTLGSISLARRIEVYSRRTSKSAFLYTYIDLDEIVDGQMKYIPYPTEKNPEDEYTQLLTGSSGTIVLLKKCDRVNSWLDELPHYLGRTYRKFIEKGLDINVGSRMLHEAQTAFKFEHVYLHDPLYMAGPTRFDVENPTGKDPKASDWGEETIQMPIPNTDGETAEIRIRFSLLPEEWRKQKGDGASDTAKKRRITENEGISILRADREVLYGHVPYITGQKGTAKAMDVDRWWGCEISFPPELDDYFHVRYIKRGAEPTEEVRDQIRAIITPVVNTARKAVRQVWAKNAGEEQQAESVFAKAEETVSNIQNKLFDAKKGTDIPQEEEHQKMEALLDQSVEINREAEEKREKKRQEKREKLKKAPFSIELVEGFSRNELFETVHLLGKTIIKINVLHPFYDKVLRPLCEEETPQANLSQVDAAEISDFKRKSKDAILLLLFGYARTEATLYDVDDTTLGNLRSRWGSMLAAAIDEYYKNEGNA